MAIENKHMSTALAIQRAADVEAADALYLKESGWVKGTDNTWSKPDPILVPTTIPEVLESPVSLPDAPEGEITPPGVAKVEEIDDTKPIGSKKG